MVDTGIKVGDCMKTKVITIKADSTAVEAAKRIKEFNVGSLLVEKDGVIQGIITEKDLVVKSLSAGDLNMKVNDFMSANLIQIEDDADLSEAAKIMGENKIKRLIVTHAGKIIGIISQKDIISISPSLYDLISQNWKSGFKTF
ncbi:MAG: CBS domain-containing protein [Candidatus Marsarchaeota archaeon]|nr:CBS domain-containing protein [Candidatus Marsarchaeota archaeon]